MIKRLLLVAVLAAACLLASPAPAHAFDPFQNDCNSDTQSSAVCTDKNPGQNPISGTGGVIIKIADIIAILAGGAGIILLLVSGLRYITSGGDPGKVKGARDTAVGVVIGLLVILLARTLIAFVISKLYS